MYRVGSARFIFKGPRERSLSPDLHGPSRRRPYEVTPRRHAFQVGKHHNGSAGNVYADDVTMFGVEELSVVSGLQTRYSDVVFGNSD